MSKIARVFYIRWSLTDGDWILDWRLAALEGTLEVFRDEQGWHLGVELQVFGRLALHAEALWRKET